VTPNSGSEPSMAARKATVIGEVVKHTAARTKATCEISALGYSREDIDVNVLSPSKIPVSYRWDHFEPTNSLLIEHLFIFSSFTAPSRVSQSKTGPTTLIVLVWIELAGFYKTFYIMQ